MSSNAIDAPAAAPSRQPAGRRRKGAFLSLLVSGGLITALYWNLDVRLVGETLLDADRLWLVLSVGMIVPITLLRALRFFWVTPRGALPGVAEAARLTVVASAFNVFLPAKTGDLVKSYFVAKRGHVSAGVSIAIVVYERLCDLFGLITWCLVGWLVGQPQAAGLPALFWPILAAFGALCAVLISSEVAAELLRRVIQRVLRSGRLSGLRHLAEGWPDLLQLIDGRRRLVVPFSLALWLVHLFQIWTFTVTLGADVPFTVCASLAAVALMAGQLPWTFAGLGSTDVALVVLLAAYMPAESAAAMGVLISTRNLLPPLFGIPFMRPYLASAVDEARRWKRGVAEEPA
ncbi:MAG: flippase-like domain-containing protein [Acidimicrobiia bacterium]|nr:flippase-like domain-containing protein [Acidimicrobiia bacterium]